MKRYLPLLFLTLLAHNANAQLANSDFSSLEQHIHKVIDSLKIPGLQIAITSGDSVAFIKGYGFSNLETQTPVDPYTTKFHIGSITKVFTAIAVQNAANEGVLNIDEDISEYLDFELDRLPQDRITLNDLLSHSAGIDEMWFNEREDYVSIEALGQTLDRFPLTQIRPAGETFSYSNLSVILSGYILAKETQKPVYKHYQDVIYLPLGLKNTGVFLETDDPDYPVSYYLLDDEFVVSPRGRTSLYTSGKIYSTADDMSKFMRALLNQGMLDGTYYLESDYLIQISAKGFRNKEHDEYGSGLGIFITDTKKGTVYSHLGFIEGFASNMYLFENENVGIFTTANSQKGIQALEEIFYYFLKEHLPHYRSDALNAENNLTINNLIINEQFEGNYIPTRTSLSTIGRIESLFSTKLSFYISEGGIPILKSGNQSIKLVPHEDNKFVDTTKFVHKTISFHDNGDRTIMNYAVDKGIYGIWPFMKLKWYEQRNLQYSFRVICLLFFLFTPLIWLGHFFLLKATQKISPKKILLSIAMFSGAIGFIIFTTSAMDYERLFMMSNEALPWQINAFALLNITSAFFTALVLVFTVFSTKEKFYSLDYLLIVLLITTAVNNYLFNSFSIIYY